MLVLVSEVGTTVTVVKLMLSGPILICATAARSEFKVKPEDESVANGVEVPVQSTCKEAGSHTWLPIPHAPTPGCVERPPPA